VVDAVALFDLFDKAARVFRKRRRAVNVPYHVVEETVILCAHLAFLSFPPGVWGKSAAD
jgi:hypothetical protein